MVNHQKCNSVIVASIALLLINPLLVSAHAGHGAHAFQENGAVGNQPIEVDAQTVKRLGLKVEVVKAQQLAVGLKTTRQIELVPDRN